MILKIRVNNIYDDNHTLFASNTLVLSDDRLNIISDMINDLDLIASVDFDSREIVDRYLKPDNSEYRVYDLTKIHRAIYSCIVQNLTKYTALIESDNLLDSDVFRAEYGEKIVHGENVKTYDYANRVDTTSHGNIANTKQYGAIQKTNTFGDIDTTDNIGATTENTTVGARQNTSAVTTFDSTIFNDTDKTSSATASDSTSSSSQLNTSKITHGNETESTTTHTDTENITHGNDSITHGAHIDVITDDETIDTKEGYRDLMGNVDRVRRIYSQSVLKEIVNDCINHFTYSCYI